MASDQVTIANTALQFIGSRRIASFTEDSAEARAISAVYADVLDEVLSEAPWTFAQKRAALATSTITPIFNDDRMTVVYAKPADLLKINFISNPTAIIKVEQDGIYSDTLSIKIIYTFRNTDPTTYFSKFTSALSKRLAAEVCFTLSNSVAKTQEVMELYQTIYLPAATAQDSQQNTPDQPMQDDALIARIYGNTGFATPLPGAQTWSPVW